MEEEKQNLPAHRILINCIIILIQFICKTVCHHQWKKTIIKNKNVPLLSVWFSFINFINNLMMFSDNQKACTVHTYLKITLYLFWYTEKILRSRNHELFDENIKRDWNEVCRFYNLTRRVRSVFVFFTELTSAKSKQTKRREIENARI